MGLASALLFHPQESPSLPRRNYRRGIRRVAPLRQG